MRWVRWIVVPVLAAAGTVVAVAGPAAAVPGLVTVSTTGTMNTDVGKFQTVFCPGTLVVLAGGGEIVYGNSPIRLTTSRPGSLNNSWEVWAHTIGSFSSAWALKAWAVCGPKPAGYSSTKVTVEGSPSTAVAEKPCPTGRQVLGVGGSALFGSEAVLDEISPLAGLGGARVVVRGDGTDTRETLTAEAYAICATPIPGLQAIANSTASNSTTLKVISAFCPAGTQPHGAGADIVGGLGAVHLDGIGYFATGVYAQAREHPAGYPDQWVLKVFAICAT